MSVREGALQKEKGPRPQTARSFYKIFMWMSENHSRSATVSPCTEKKSKRLLLDLRLCPCKHSDTMARTSLNTFSTSSTFFRIDSSMKIFYLYGAALANLHTFSASNAADVANFVGSRTFIAVTASHDSLCFKRHKAY